MYSTLTSTLRVNFYMQLLWCLRPECNATFLVMFQATLFNHAFTLSVACINVHANLKGRHMESILQC